MQPVVIGVDYRHAPLSVREPLAVAPAELPDLLQRLPRECGVSGLVILSTCHRVEWYLEADDVAAATERCADWLRQRSLTEALPLSIARGDAAVAHLMRVAAGLDSMVLGESEIAAQVKGAYQAALAVGATTPLLNRLFQKALHAAKLARATTGIARGQASIGSAVAALLARECGGRLSQREALLWGAGKAADATARHLMKAGIRQLWVVNRTASKADDLASVCRGRVLSWEEALRHLAHVDIAVVCTQAPHYVIDEHDVDTVAAARAGRLLHLIDLAVPRNINPAVSAHPMVRLSNVDDLECLAAAARSQRESDRSRAEWLVQSQVELFMQRVESNTSKEGAPCHYAESVP